MIVNYENALMLVHGVQTHRKWISYYRYTLKEVMNVNVIPPMPIPLNFEVKGASFSSKTSLDFRHSRRISGELFWIESTVHPLETKTGVSNCVSRSAKHTSILTKAAVTFCVRGSATHNSYNSDGTFRAAGSIRRFGCSQQPQQVFGWIRSR